MSNKVLVAYFSASGTTAQIAKAIAKTCDTDLFEIKPEQPYTSADLNWNNKSSRSTLEMNNPASRPAIANKVNNMDFYDTILIGFPIWWYVAPKIIDTFLETYNFSGKKIALFATSGGSGMGRSEEVLKTLASDSTIWLNGKRIRNNSEAEKWVKSLGL